MDIKRVLLMVGTTFLFTALFVPVVKKMANFIGALDMPNERKVHKVPIPRLGGLGIYAGFLLGYMLFGIHSVQMNAILIGSFIILVTGIFDDIKPVPAKWKLLAQTVGASIIPLYGGILLKDISAFGLYLNFGILAYPITIIFIVAIINCINLIDGLDGLSSGIASIYFLTIGIIALLGFKNVTLTSFIIPILLLAIPILDTLFAILRRLINHKPLGEPDKNHLHHQLLKLKLSQKKTVIIIYIVDLLFASASIVYAVGNSMLGSNIYGMVIYAILFVLILLLILKTNNSLLYIIDYFIDFRL